MDRFGEWRPIEPAAKKGADEQSSTRRPPGRRADGPEANASSVRLFGLLGAGVLAIVGAAIWLTNPSSGSEKRLDVAAAAGLLLVRHAGWWPDWRRTHFERRAAELVIDVQGAVVAPGVHRLPRAVASATRSTRPVATQHRSISRRPRQH